MATLGELIVKVGADISSFTKGMSEVNNSMSKTGKSLGKVGKSMTNLGKDMSTKVTAPLVALGATAVVTGASFDQQMSKVQAVSGATGTEFEKLRNQAKQLGATTVWSASEAGAGMEFLARAGWSVEEIMSAMPSVLNLATAGAIDLGTASDIASNIMSGFGATAQESERYIDVLAKTMSRSNTDMNQLGDAMKYVAPVASNLGLSVEETASAIGLMSDAGIQGSQAGTALRGGLSRLMNPVGEAKKAMEALGFSAYDSNGKFKGLSTILAELDSKTKNMTEAQRNQTLAMLFGQEAGSGWLAMMARGSDDLSEFTTMLENSDGTAQQMATTMSDNLAGSFKGLLSALEGLAISFSDVLTPAIRKITEWLTNVTRKFDGLNPNVKLAIVVIAGLVAGIAPLLTILGFMITGISGVVTVLGLISAPVLIVIGVLTALGVAFMALWTKSETFREKVKQVFNAIKETITTVINTVKTFLQEKLTQIQQFWAENGTQILQAVENAFNGIKAVIDFVMPAVLAIVKYIWNAIKGVIDGALNIIMGLIKIFSGLFTGDFSKMWEGVKQLFKGAIQFVWNLMNLSFVGGIKKLVVSLVKNIVKFIKNLWDDIALKFMYGKDKVVSLVTGLKNGAVNVFKSLWNLLKSIATSIWNGIKNIFNRLKSTVSTIFNSIRSFASSVWNGIKSVISSVVSSIRSTVSNIFNSVKSKVSSVFNGIKSVASRVWNGIKDTITRPIQTAKNTIMGIINTIKNAFNQLKIKIPKPRLPKVSVSMRKGVMGIPYPDFDISWNAKGGIFNGATLLGGGQGVGERGAEAVLPIQHKRYMKPFANAVAGHLKTDEEKEPIVIENVTHTTIELDNEVIGTKTEKTVSRKQMDRQNRTNRRLGR